MYYSMYLYRNDIGTGQWDTQLRMLIQLANNSFEQHSHWNVLSSRQTAFDDIDCEKANCLYPSPIQN